MSFIEEYFAEVVKIVLALDIDKIDGLAVELNALRKRKGRLFILGVGGSAANASHAVNDFRKLCGIEAYAPTDNISEITARTNDEGWDTVFAWWLKVSNFTKIDAILILSVGGGNAQKKVSQNLIHAIDYANIVGAKVFGIVGKEGYTSEKADISIMVPTVNRDRITPHSEAFQAVIWHCLVSHPLLQTVKTKW